MKDGRIMGIDYGSRRVGVAISDEGCKYALPHIVLDNTSSLNKGIQNIIDQNNVKGIVIGESRNYKGEPNPILEDIQAFKKEWEGKGVRVFLEPEFMTSMQAERLQGKNDMSDASAAAIILQSFLDRDKTAQEMI